MYEIFKQTYRERITVGGVQKQDLKGKSKSDHRTCPIFAYDGDLLANWYYSNNGMRLGLDGQSESSENQNDDSTFGLGMEFA